MSWLKDFAGGFASSSANALLGFGLNHAATKYAAKQQADMYKHRYQWAVDDMRQAGLNPILAATSGIGGSFSGASALGTSVPSLGSESSAMSSSALSRKQANNADALAKSTIEANAASANKLAADAAAVRQSTDFAGKYFPYELAFKRSTLDNARQQLKFLKSQTDKQEYEKSVVLPAMANMYILQGKQAASSAALNEQNTALSKANTDLIGLQSHDYEKYGISPHNVTGWGTPIARLLDKIKSRYFDNPNR